MFSFLFFSSFFFAYSYLNNVLAYIRGFISRSQPLLDLKLTEEKFLEEFSSQYESGEFLAWPLDENVITINVLLNRIEKAQVIDDDDLMAAAKSTENESSNKSLFCDVCNKQFTKDTVFDAHFSGKKHKKAAERVSKKNWKGKEDSSNNIYLYI